MPRRHIRTEDTTATTATVFANRFIVIASGGNLNQPLITQAKIKTTPKFFPESNYMLYERVHGEKPASFGHANTHVQTCGECQSAKR